MALSAQTLTDALVRAYTETSTVTEYDANSGLPKLTLKTFKPDRKKLEKLATEIVNHITNSSEVYGVNSSVTATVAPGIPTTTGSTIGPGNANGTANQTGTGKLR